ncbi:MAG TPA: ketoacyl-ACP synthase III [Chitinophagaceae bacterium]|nr:ketoacyl-ACP synthase III [Chitinophagaceae bacterium]
MRTVITGSGSFIPANIKKNNSFIGQLFYDENRQLIEHSAADIISKFQQITGIIERRYADTGMNASCMAVEAAKRAIADAGINAESIDQLIVAHNFGDVLSNSIQPDTVPSIASRVKHRLGILNSSCVAYDLLFGCPGWLQGLIQADAYTRAGMAKTCLVIGTEALSRVTDPYDRDSMIYSDGAGAVITQISNDDNGIIGSRSASFAADDIAFISMGQSNYTNGNATTNYLKMQGRKVYEFALRQVPLAIKGCLDDCGIHLSEVKKIFIHQANEKMDEAIVNRLFKLYHITDVPQDIMPMNIQTLGNSSVATIPTLYNMVSKGLLHNHALRRDDIIVFASVGAGMNINAVCYRV